MMVFFLEESKKGRSPGLEAQSFRAERTMKFKPLVKVKAGAHDLAQIKDLVCTFSVGVLAYTPTYSPESLQL